MEIIKSGKKPEKQKKPIYYINKCRSCGCRFKAEADEYRKIGRAHV